MPPQFRAQLLDALLRLRFVYSLTMQDYRMLRRTALPDAIPPPNVSTNSALNHPPPLP